MPNSQEIRRLTSRWAAGTAWPKRLEWIRIGGLRGWNNQRFDMKYPIMAVVGENGVGKSTVLQSAAAVYRQSRGKAKYASDFFPDTFWERITGAEIEYSVREGAQVFRDDIRKLTERWRGNPERRERPIVYIDLSRIQPVPARVGYTKLVKADHRETSAELFDPQRLGRFSEIMGRSYDSAKMALTNIHATRQVPVIAHDGATYSGFHQGAGETTIAELLKADWPQYAIILIDEIETSLHPRAQRRLIRDIADRCRERELQVILTTHSPYVLEELPPEARAYIMNIGHTREIVYGVSAAFAMTKMDEVQQPECDLYVEDNRARDLLLEIIVAHGSDDLSQRCRIIPYGASSVGQALGQMVEQRRFPQPSCVFLDGDQARAAGCILLPGDDAPERVVFEAMKAKNWEGIAPRVGRDFSKVADACARAMTINDHHEWLDDAGTQLKLRTDILWQVLCSEWARKCLSPDEAQKITQPVEDAVAGLAPEPIPAVKPRPTEPAMSSRLKPTKGAAPSGTLPLFEQFFDVGQS
jgi:predicted ATPase